MKVTPDAGDTDFRCLSTLPDSRARVHFAGRFQGRDVLWDMQLHALQGPCRGRGTVATRRAFIDIASGEGDVLQLEVGLDVPVIDLPTVRKAVLMIRNYRRLRLGRHEWGEPVPDSTRGDSPA